MRDLFIGLFLIMNFSAVHAAPVTVYEFDTEEQEAIFQRLAHEIRCLVCQNQSIAESNAELAVDLRQQVHEMLLEGKTEEEIVDFMVERYGDYVLFDPPVKPITWGLWFGPGLLFLIALFYVVRLVRDRNRDTAGSGTEQGTLDEETKRRLDHLRSEMDDRGSDR